MENKHVGFLLLGVAALLVVIVFLFKGALTEIVNTSCSMEEEFCPMYNTINQQTYLALAIVGVLVIIALVLIFTKPKEKIVVRTIKEKKKRHEQHSCAERLNFLIRKIY